MIDSELNNIKEQTCCNSIHINKRCRNDLSIFLNKEFYNFQDLEETIKLYEKDTNVKLIKTTHKNINQNNLNKNKIFNIRKNIKYSYIRFVCELSTIKRKKIINKTKKIGCSFALSFGLNNKKNSLILKNKTNHNEHIQFNNKYFKLSDKSKNIINISILSSAKPSKIIQNLDNLDRNNLSKIALKNHISKIRNNIDLQKKQKIDNLILNKDLIEIFDKQNYKLGNYFQDRYMKNIFQIFGQILFIDSTYNIFQSKSSIFIISCINLEGKTEIIGLFDCIDETEETLMIFFKTFCNNNQNFENIVKLIITDKDFVERKILKKLFIKSHFRLCSFHIQRTFETILKKKTNKNDYLNNKKILLELINTKNKSDYYNKIKNLSDDLKNYFDKNWNKIKNEFIPAFYVSNFGYYETTNNRAESINNKIKNFLGKNKKFDFDLFYSNLKDMLDNDRIDFSTFLVKNYCKLINFPKLNFLTKIDELKILNLFISKLSNYYLKISMSCQCDNNSICYFESLSNIPCFQKIIKQNIDIEIIKFPLWVCKDSIFLFLSFPILNITETELKISLKNIKEKNIQDLKNSYNIFENINNKEDLSQDNIIEFNYLENLNDDSQKLFLLDSEINNDNILENIENRNIYNSSTIKIDDDINSDLKIFGIKKNIKLYQKDLKYWFKEIIRFLRKKKYNVNNGCRFLLNYLTTNLNGKKVFKLLENEN